MTEPPFPGTTAPPGASSNCFRSNCLENESDPGGAGAGSHPISTENTWKPRNYSLKTLSQITAALGVVISLFFGAGLASAQAVLTPEKGFRIDLGTIPVGQPFTFYLDYINEGDQPLIIQQTHGYHPWIKIQNFENFVIPGGYSSLEGTVHARAPGRRSSRLGLFTTDGPIHFELSWNAQ